LVDHRVFLVTVLNLQQIDSIMIIQQRTKTAGH
jgi:hypothetical protein